MKTRDPSRLPRRFYKSAAIVQDPKGWRIELDGRELKTPARAGLVVPSEPLASGIAAEWADQGDHLDIQRMHLTRLANVAIDRAPETRAELADELARYCETDLVCHLADGPEPLRERQDKAWRPVRDWAGQALGVLLVPIEGILATAQPPVSLQAARDHSLGLDDFRATGLAFGCGLFGSALLALAVEQGRLSAQDAFDASRTDEQFQAEHWGEDEEAAATAAARRFEALALGVWFAAL